MHAIFLKGSTLTAAITHVLIISRYHDNVIKGSCAAIAIDESKTFTPHYAKKNKRGKFKRGGR